MFYNQGELVFREAIMVDAIYSKILRICWTWFSANGYQKHSDFNPEQLEIME